MIQVLQIREKGASKNLVFVFSVLFLFLSSCHRSESPHKPVESETGSTSQSLPALKPPTIQTSQTAETIQTVVSPQTRPEKVQPNLEPPKPEAKNPWPPEGPYCRQFVDCCEEAQKIRGKASMLCLSIASREPLDCQKGLQEVADFIKNLKLPLPRYCE